MSIKLLHSSLVEVRSLCATLLQNIGNMLYKLFGELCWICSACLFGAAERWLIWKIAEMLRCNYRAKVMLCLGFAQRLCFKCVAEMCMVAGGSTEATVEEAEVKSSVFILGLLGFLQP